MAQHRRDLPITRTIEANPVARALRHRRAFAPRIVASQKRYRRAVKHRKRALAIELEG